MKLTPAIVKTACKTLMKLIPEGILFFSSKLRLLRCKRHNVVAKRQSQNDWKLGQRHIERPSPSNPEKHTVELGSKDHG